MLKLFSANPRPSSFLKRIRAHNGDVSEGSKTQLVARRKVLGYTVRFYQNGLRLIEGLGLTEQEQFDSQILRYAHASILIDGPVGDRKTCYVNATVDPVEIVLYGLPAKLFLKRAKLLVESGQLEGDFLLEEHVKKTSELKNERNVRLFGR
jgi:hypothetical protein